MSDIASLEADIRQYQEQVDVVSAGLRDDPSNEELLALKAELDEAIGLLKETLDEMRPAKPAPKPRQPSPPPVKEKWSRENHPAFKKATAATPPPPPEETVDITYKVNDSVMAKWVSGDKAFYAARITSITGSSTDPIYIVKFKDYNETDQVRGKDIRPITNKRKADDTAPSVSTSSAFSAPTINSPAYSAPSASAASTSSSVQPASNAPGVISAAASIDLDLAKRSREAAEQAAAGGADAKPKAKKIRATKELETGKKSWQEFNTKSKFAKASKNKKESMFRTPEGVHGRVGFTGSGQTMRKDPTRSRHIYQTNEDMD